jgi:hypothetical protein
MPFRVYFDGLPTVRLTVHASVPEKLVIPGSAWCRVHTDTPHHALAKAIAAANGLRLVTCIAESEEWSFRAFYSTRRTIGAGCYMPAAEVWFKVAKEGEK